MTAMTAALYADVTDALLKAGRRDLVERLAALEPKETLTSSEAESSIAKKDRRAVRDSGLIDSRAACLILQDYLDQKFPPQIPGQD